MEKRVTMKDIALKAGVHQTTVSMAFRNHPRIPEKTRNRICSIAERMGYRPDPLLSALAIYRTSKRPVTAHGEIGLLRKANLSGASHDSIMKGLLCQAERHGYTLTEFFLDRNRTTPEQINRIVRSRNIRGIILYHLHAYSKNFLERIDWDTVSAVRIGRSPKWPPITDVEYNQYATMQHILQVLLQRKYLRIGLIHDWENLKSLAFFPEAAYLHTLHRSKQAQDFPIFYTDRRPLSEIPAWAGKHRLDAVICNQMPDWLFPKNHQRQAFLKQYGFVCLNLVKTDGSVAGFDQCLEHLGQCTVDTLVSQMNNGNRGFPPVTMNIQILGRWVEGKTIRPRK